MHFPLNFELKCCYSRSLQTCSPFCFETADLQICVPVNHFNFTFVALIFGQCNYVLNNSCIYHSMHFFFLSIGREPSANHVILQNKILLMRTELLLCKNDRLLKRQRFIPLPENKLVSDRMIKQLLNSVIAKYRDLSVSCRSIICLSQIWPTKFLS